VRDERDTLRLIAQPRADYSEGLQSFEQIGTVLNRALVGLRAPESPHRAGLISARVVNGWTRMVHLNEIAGKAPSRAQPPIPQDELRNETTGALAAPASWGRGSTCDPGGNC
jgi:hypothetical protein